MNRKWWHTAKAKEVNAAVRTFKESQKRWVDKTPEEIEADVKTVVAAYKGIAEENGKTFPVIIVDDPIPVKPK